MSLLPARFQTSDDMPMSLGKAIARAIAPKVDPNAWFDAVARQYPDDKPPKAARTVEDVLSDPTEDEMQYVSKLRGGCRCSWPNAAPPCSICTTEYSEEEAAEALAECSQEPAPSPDAEDGGWVTWKGGECPLDKNTPVLAKNTFGEQIVLAPKPASLFNWAREHHITAYKVIA